MGDVVIGKTNDAFSGTEIQAQADTGGEYGNDYVFQVRPYSGPLNDHLPSRTFDGLRAQANRDGTGVVGKGAMGVVGDGDRCGVHGLGGNPGITQNPSDELAGVWGENRTVGPGVYGKAPSGAGVRGHSTKGNGVHGTTGSSGASGVYGENSASGSGGYGVAGRAPSGNGVYGETQGWTGVWGRATATGTGVSGTSESGFGVSGSSTSAIGVSGQSETNYGVSGMSSGAHGVRGSTADDSWSGVYGYHPGNGSAVSGETSKGTGVIGRSTNGRGVWGISDQLFATVGDSVSGIGIYGHSLHGLGVYGEGQPAARFVGDVYVTGTLHKGTIAFRIDHPLDPANKYLCHSGVESPDMKNVYDGVATLDGQGEATVQLPAWFEALNDDYRYQLTCIGGYAPVHIAEKINDNRFKIAGGGLGMEVSWQVTGIRRDAFAAAHRIEVEKDKPEHERGRYIHPELHNQPEEKRLAPIADLSAMGAMAGPSEPWQ